MLGNYDQDKDPMNIYNQQKDMIRRLADVRQTLQDPTIPAYARKEFTRTEADYVKELEKIRKAIVLADQFEKMSKGWTA